MDVDLPVPARRFAKRKGRPDDLASAFDSSSRDVAKHARPGYECALRLDVLQIVWRFVETDALAKRLRLVCTTWRDALDERWGFPEVVRDAVRLRPSATNLEDDRRGDDCLHAAYMYLERAPTRKADREAPKFAMPKLEPAALAAARLGYRALLRPEDLGHPRVFNALLRATPDARLAAVAKLAENAKPRGAAHAVLVLAHAMRRGRRDLVAIARPWVDDAQWERAWRYARKYAVVQRKLPCKRAAFEASLALSADASLGAPVLWHDELEGYQGKWHWMCPSNGVSDAVLRGLCDNATRGAKAILNDRLWLRSNWERHCKGCILCTPFSDA